MSISALVLGTICKFNMIQKGDSVLAAVSGGADSVCMLHVLFSLKNSIGFSLACAHVNHGLRGDAADRDEEFVKNLCRELKVPFYSKKYDVASVAAEKKQTVEEAGRNVRYEFFEELKEEHGFNKIATAHNKNDNAETVLMRIIRGTGIDGLSGISYVREDGVIRPILDITRAEIESYCKDCGLEYCTDSTNWDNDYTRNKIRNELIPYLEKEFNSNIKESLVRLSVNAGEDSSFLKGYASRVLERLGSTMPLAPNALHIESFKYFEKSIGARILRMAAEKSSSGVKLEKCHIDDIFALLEKPTGTSIDLPGGLKASVNYGWLTFEGPKDKADVVFDSDEFFAEISVGETVFVDSLGKSISLREEDSSYRCKINETMLDLDLLGNQPLFLRSRRDGDKIVFFKDGRTKKIKKIFIDDKIPKKDRNKIPLLATGSEVIAIVGSRISEKYKITKETRRALVIEYGTD